MTTGCLLLLRLEAGQRIISLIPGFVSLGGGVGLLVPPLTSTLLASVDEANAGVASGVLNSARQIGSVAGVALFGSLMVSGTAGFLSGTRLAIEISIIVLALTLAIVLLVLRASQARPA
jgi:DHA2 family methylenomycin A resistance protein-like MFS transporter